ncbi:MAG: hypothetical protein CVU39_19835 [Chloroflexi bacterium HGW-Chloroflexi-10]|nr:MAG: hypothetical protein CVU39_19835 [Chloroflexi bacterium HGW-Chloroflexi-10]
MENRKTSYAWGIILVLFGGLLLANQLIPNLRISLDWPWIVMGVGAVFILLAIFTRTGGLAIPGSIVGGIGAILYYQDLTGNWETWSFAWTLIPGFIGVGIALATLISPRENPDGWSSSITMLVISLITFILFGGSLYFGLGNLVLWPILVIGLGLFLLVKGLLKK